jgi:hypothetical protein
MRDVAPFDPTVIRQVFPNWSITIPSTFAETFVEADGYWHAWDVRRSVSLTSLLIDDRRGRPVSSRSILKRFPAAPGERVGMPSGLDGWAMVITQPPPARAPRAISGLIVLHGRVLIATVTADDLAWATSVWRSIRSHPDPGPGRRSSGNPSPRGR